MTWCANVHPSPLSKHLLPTATLCVMCKPHGSAVYEDRNWRDLVWGHAKWILYNHMGRMSYWKRCKVASLHFRFLLSEKLNIVEEKRIAAFKKSFMTQDTRKYNFSFQPIKSNCFYYCHLPNYQLYDLLPYLWVFKRLCSCAFIFHTLLRNQHNDLAWEKWIQSVCSCC